MGGGTLGGPSGGNYALRYSKDGRLLAVGGWDRQLRIFDATTGKEIRTIHNVATGRFVRELSFSPDGKQIVTGGSGSSTRLWDVATGEQLPCHLPDDLCPSFLPNGKEVACWTFRAGRVTLCDIPSGRNRRVIPAHPPNIEGLAVSPDGRFLATCGSDGVKLWRVSDQKQVTRLDGHRGAVYAAAFSADGKRLATVGLEDLTVRIWDLPEAFHTRQVVSK
jgi:WD40 repeat protein